MFKTTLLVPFAAAAAFLGASATFAQEATPAPEFDRFVSQKSRAEVRAETQDAARHRLIARNDLDLQRLAEPGFRSLKSRAQVRAETAEAARLGLIAHGEAGAPQAIPQQEEQIRAAGLRVIERERLLARK